MIVVVVYGVDGYHAVMQVMVGVICIFAHDRPQLVRQTREASSSDSAMNQANICQYLSAYVQKEILVYQMRLANSYILYTEMMVLMCGNVGHARKSLLSNNS